MRGKRVAVGLSGGLDSVVLLHLLRGLAPRLRCRLSAVHVNHGLSPNAGDWQKFCKALCLTGNSVQGDQGQSKKARTRP
jgi:tRNA(Ile)-lysidine synthase